MYCCGACSTSCIWEVGRAQVFSDILVLPSLVLLTQPGTLCWDRTGGDTVG